jgi:hypothetical protein
MFSLKEGGFIPAHLLEWRADKAFFLRVEELFLESISMVLNAGIDF